MSIPVDVTELEQALAHFGSAYLLTVSPIGTVKVVSARPALADGVLRVSGPGRGSVANVGGNASVTLVFPPVVADDLTLLVDGVATVDGDDVVIEPTGAVLHKAAT